MNRAIDEFEIEGVPVDDGGITSEAVMRQRVVGDGPVIMDGWSLLALALSTSWTLNEYVVVTAPTPPGPDYYFPPFQDMPGHGQIPVIVHPGAPPRPLMCSEKERNLREMEKLIAILTGGTLAYNQAASEIRSIPRLANLAQRFQRTYWFHAVIGAVVTSFYAQYRNAPCTPDQA